MTKDKSKRKAIERILASMGFVHIEQYVGVSFFQTHQCREVGLVTVHAEDAFGDDDDLAKGGVVLFEQPFPEPAVGDGQAAAVAQRRAHAVVDGAAEAEITR